MADGKLMDSYEGLAQTEISFIRNQAAWLYALGSGLMDHAPLAGQRLLQQAQLYAEEAGAAERRRQAIADATAPKSPAAPTSGGADGAA